MGFDARQKLQKLFRMAKVRMAAEKSNKPFHEQYVAVVEEKLSREKGRSHPTLMIPGMDGQMKNHGKGAMRRLQAEGLKSHHRLLDYGCGSLRLGREVIPYLDAGNYFGLDVTEKFFTGGLETFDSVLIKEKQPNLGLIESTLADELKNNPPDYFICMGVLLHVPPVELNDFLSRISAFFGPSTRGILGAKLAIGDETVKKNLVTWFHDLPSVRMGLENAGLRLEVNEPAEVSPTNASNAAGVEEIFRDYILILEKS